MQQVFVRTLSDKSIRLEVQPQYTIYHIKQMIEERENVSVPEQRLIFGGKQLEDERTLADYQITDGMTMHLVLRLRG